MSSDQELEEQLKKQAEGVIKRILADRKPVGENSLKDIEQMAIQAGQGFREQVLHYLAKERARPEKSRCVKIAGGE